MAAEPETRQIGTRQEFIAFLDAYDKTEFRNRVSETSGQSPSEVGRALDTYFAEMRFGYDFLSEHLPVGQLRILEVGAGLGLLSIYLKQLGHEVTALEPSGLSFDLFETTKHLIWSTESSDKPVLIEEIAEDLDPDRHGRFDFIFSINVMEHIADIDRATQAILGVLKPGGICINSCPNYWVPYEPHYAIPMVPFAHGLTRKLFASRIDPDPEIWDSLNFISWGKVRAMAKRNGVGVHFEDSLIHKSFLRLGEDAEFMARHEKGLAGRIYTFLTRTRLLSMLKFLPPALNTPMVFTYRRSDQL